MQNDKFIRRIINLREENNLSQVDLAKKLDMDKSTMSKIEHGTRKVSSDELQKMVNIFNVSADYLLGNTDKKHYYDLTDKEKTDLGILADKLLEGSTSEAESDFYGEPSTDEQKANLRAAIMTALELNKTQAKKKFTPKKYRDNTDNN